MFWFDRIFSWYGGITKDTGPDSLTSQWAQPFTTATITTRRNKQVLSILSIDPIRDRSWAQSALIASAQLAKENNPAIYIKLSTTIQILTLLYEGWLLPELWSTKIPIHIELDTQWVSIKKVTEEVVDTVSILLSLIEAGYDVSATDGVYSDTFDKRPMQKQIRAYREFQSTQWTSHWETEKEQQRIQLQKQILSEMRIYSKIEALKKV